MLGSWTLQIGVSKHRGREEEMRKRGSTYSKTTKGIARKKASIYKRTILSCTPDILVVVHQNNPVLIK